MADRFYSDLEVPEISTDPGPPDSGFVRVYARNGRLYVRNSANEIDLTIGGTGGDRNIDGGAAASAYLPTQVIDGGTANG